MSNHGNRLHVARFESKSDITPKMPDAFSWLGDSIVKPGDRVFIKPNLTYPFRSMTASSGLMFCGGHGKKYARTVEAPG